jgi:hypothetical protein
MDEMLTAATEDFVSRDRHRIRCFTTVNPQSKAGNLSISGQTDQSQPSTGTIIPQNSPTMCNIHGECNSSVAVGPVSSLGPLGDLRSHSLPKDMDQLLLYTISRTLDAGDTIAAEASNLGERNLSPKLLVLEDDLNLTWEISPAETNQGVITVPST